jgi:hypothetical protein
MAGTTNAPSKKFRSKWTRIAVEGATTDGRQIERSWIADMAAQYSQNTYGARINCEHIKGYWPGGEFGAYGDVLALKAEEAEIGGVKKLALFAQLEPNAALLALNKAGQKVYTSIEVNPKFADTNKAYLMGLAITDTPASLGTEALSFSAQHGTMASRKTQADNLFSAAEESQFEFDEVTDQPSMFAALKLSITELLSKNTAKDSSDASNFTELGEALQGLLTFTTQQADAATNTAEQLASLQTQFSQLTADLKALQTKLGTTEDHRQQPRPPATGGDGTVLTAY